MAETIVGCNTFSSIPLPCKDNIGGIKKCWLASYDGFSFTIDTGHTCTAITTGITTLYQVIPARVSSSIAEEQSIDTTNTIWKQTITLVFPKNYTSLRNFVNSLGKSILVAVVLDRNDKYWLMGSDYGLQVGTKHESGTAEGDKNQWTITLEGTEKYSSVEVSASVMIPYTS